MIVSLVPFSSGVELSVASALKLGDTSVADTPNADNDCISLFITLTSV